MGKGNHSIFILDFRTDGVNELFDNNAKAHFIYSKVHIYMDDFNPKIHKRATEGKTVEKRFLKDVTKTRRNEARLCRVRILTMFWKVRRICEGGEKKKNRGAPKRTFRLRFSKCRGSEVKYYLPPEREAWDFPFRVV